MREDVILQVIINWNSLLVRKSLLETSFEKVLETFTWYLLINRIDEIILYYYKAGLAICYFKSYLLGHFDKKKLIFTKYLVKSFSLNLTFK